MASVLGLDAWSGLNTGTIAAPTWSEIGTIKEESFDLSMAIADVTTRAAAGWRLQRGTLIEGTISMTMQYSPNNTEFNTIETAFFARTQLILGLFDGDVTATGTYYGIHGAANVVNFSQTRPLEDAIVVDVEFAFDLETTTETAPDWVTIVTAE